MDIASLLKMAGDGDDLSSSSCVGHGHHHDYYHQSSSFDGHGPRPTNNTEELNMSFLEWLQCHQFLAPSERRRVDSNDRRRRPTTNRDDDDLEAAATTTGGRVRGGGKRLRNGDGDGGGDTGGIGIPAPHGGGGGGGTMKIFPSQRLAFAYLDRELLRRSRGSVRQRLLSLRRRRHSQQQTGGGAGGGGGTCHEGKERVKDSDDEMAGDSDDDSDADAAADNHRRSGEHVLDVRDEGDGNYNDDVHTLRAWAIESPDPLLELSHHHQFQHQTSHYANRRNQQQHHQQQQTRFFAVMSIADAARLSEEIHRLKSTAYSSSNSGDIMMMMMTKHWWSNPHLYEVIREGTPCGLYFDVERDAGAEFVDPHGFYYNGHQLKKHNGDHPNTTSSGMEFVDPHGSTSAAALTAYTDKGGNGGNGNNCSDNHIHHPNILRDRSSSTSSGGSGDNDEENAEDGYDNDRVTALLESTLPTDDPYITAQSCPSNCHTLFGSVYNGGNGDSNGGGNSCNCSSDNSGVLFDPTTTHTILIREVGLFLKEELGIDTVDDDGDQHRHSGHHKHAYGDGVNNHIQHRRRHRSHNVMVLESSNTSASTAANTASGKSSSSGAGSPRYSPDVKFSQHYVFHLVKQMQKLLLQKQGQGKEEGDGEEQQDEDEDVACCFPDNITCGLFVHQFVKRMRQIVRTAQLLLLLLQKKKKNENKKKREKRFIAAFIQRAKEIHSALFYHGHPYNHSNSTSSSSSSKSIGSSTAVAMGSTAAVQPVQYDTVLVKVPLSSSSSSTAEGTGVDRNLLQHNYTLDSTRFGTTAEVEGGEEEVEQASGDPHDHQQHQQQYFMHREEKCMPLKCVVDEAVYTRNRVFRCFHSSKMNKHPVLDLHPEWYGGGNRGGSRVGFSGVGGCGGGNKKLRTSLLPPASLTFREYFELSLVSYAPCGPVSATSLLTTSLDTTHTNNNTNTSPLLDDEEAATFMPFPPRCMRTLLLNDDRSDSSSSNRSSGNAITITAVAAAASPSSSSSSSSALLRSSRSAQEGAAAITMPPPPRCQLTVLDPYAIAVALGGEHLLQNNNWRRENNLGKGGNHHHAGIGGGGGGSIISNGEREYPITSAVICLISSVSPAIPVWREERREENGTSAAIPAAAPTTEALQVNQDRDKNSTSSSSFVDDPFDLVARFIDDSSSTTVGGSSSSSRNLGHHHLFNASTTTNEAAAATHNNQRRRLMMITTRIDQCWSPTATNTTTTTTTTMTGDRTSPTCAAATVTNAATATTITTSTSNTNSMTSSSNTTTLSSNDIVCFRIAGRRYCHTVGREHKSNGVYYVVDVTKGTYAQRCFDPDCKQQHQHQQHPLPNEAVQELRNKRWGAVEQVIGGGGDIDGWRKEKSSTSTVVSVSTTSVGGGQTTQAQQTTTSSSPSSKPPKKTPFIIIPKTVKKEEIKTPEENSASNNTSGRTTTLAATAEAPSTTTTSAPTISLALPSSLPDVGGDGDDDGCGTPILSLSQGASEAGETTSPFFHPPSRDIHPPQSASSVMMTESASASSVSPRITPTTSSTLSTSSSLLSPLTSTSGTGAIGSKQAHDDTNTISSTAAAALMPSPPTTSNNQKKGPICLRKKYYRPLLPTVAAATSSQPSTVVPSRSAAGNGNVAALAGENAPAVSALSDPGTARSANVDTTSASSATFPSVSDRQSYRTSEFRPTAATIMFQQQQHSASSTGHNNAHVSASTPPVGVVGGLVSASPPLQLQSQKPKKTPFRPRPVENQKEKLDNQLGKLKFKENKFLEWKNRQ